MHHLVDTSKLSTNGDGKGDIASDQKLLQKMDAAQTPTMTPAAATAKVTAAQHSDATTSAAADMEDDD